MTQARKVARRTQRLIVRVNDEEHAHIRANAAKAGMRVSEYVRRMAIDGQVVLLPSQTVVRRESAYGMALASQLRRIGVNVNQLTRLAHIDGEFPPGLVSVAEKLERLLDRILDLE